MAIYTSDQVSPARYIPDGPQTYVPIVLPRHRRRMSPMWTAFVALLAGLALSVPVMLAGAHRQGVTIIPTAPSSAQAKAACKSAIEAEAQGRLENAQRDAGDSAVPSIAGVDIAEPVRVSTGYTVDGTIRFSVLSILGSIPASVYVTCDAKVDGSKLTTSVRNR